MAGSTFSKNTVLFRGTLDSPEGNSFNIRTLDAPHGMDASHFRELASKEHYLGGSVDYGQIQGGLNACTYSGADCIDHRTIGPSPGRAGSRKVEQRRRWPRSEQRGFGRWRYALGQKGHCPHPGRIRDGATHALIEKQAVKPSIGAWQAEA